ncbi:MAG: hypothetical protein JNK82_39855 [Myxococcaceae bacterium]|nr:hypothetical protein [Myxococcaceae bacterium]
MATGVVLTQVFDEKSKTLEREFAAFEKKLVELQKKLSLGGFITATKREGTKLTVKVLPVAMQPVAGAAASAKKPTSAGWGAAPKGQSAKAVVAEVKKSVGWGPKK